VPNVPYNDGKLAYMLKGCTPPARELLATLFASEYERKGFLAATKHKSSQGVIYGKRLVISQALGPNARRSAIHASNDNVVGSEGIIAA
jgi:hypothetical protein